VVSRFAVFWDICLFRRGPQDVPHSTALLTLCLAANLALAGGLALLWPDEKTALPAAVLDALASATFIYGVVTWKNVANRFLQTFTAMTGVGLLLSVVQLPIVGWLKALEKGDPNLMMPGVLWLVLVGWATLINGNILRHALGVSWFVGALLVFCYNVAFFELFRWLERLVT
jgi:hypothetical protein